MTKVDLIEEGDLIGKQEGLGSRRNSQAAIGKSLTHLVFSHVSKSLVEDVVTLQTVTARWAHLCDPHATFIPVLQATEEKDQRNIRGIHHTEGCLQY